MRKARPSLEWKNLDPMDQEVVEDIEEDLVDLEVDTEEVHLEDQVVDIVDLQEVVQVDIAEEALVDLLVEDTEEVLQVDQVQDTEVLLEVVQEEATNEVVNHEVRNEGTEEVLQDDPVVDTEVETILERPDDIKAMIRNTLFV